MFLYQILNKREPDFVKLTRFQLIAGIIAGLFYAFALYGFMYVLREAIRLMSVTQGHDIWVLTSQQLHFYNFIFALIALILGQSITLGFWFDQPRKFVERRRYRRTAIVNDQRFLNWSFLFWFAKLAVGFAFMFVISCEGCFYTFESGRFIYYLLILIVIVLFLQTWTGIRFTFRRKSLKWMGLSMLTILALAISFSRINFVDYEAINTKVLDKNIQLKYGIEYPEAKNFERNGLPSLTEDLYIGYKENAQNEKIPVIITEEKEIKLEELDAKIAGWLSMRDESDRPLLTINLHIAKSIKMGLVKEVKAILSKHRISKIAYAVVPENAEHDKRFYQRFVFPMYLPPPHGNFYDEKCDCPQLIDFDKTIWIHVKDSSFFVNDTLTKSENLKMALKAAIPSEMSYLINLNVDDENTFSEYFKVISAGKDAVYELRDEYSVIHFSEHYEDLSIEKQYIVRRAIPYSLEEINYSIHIY